MSIVCVARRFSGREVGMANTSEFHMAGGPIDATLILRAKALRGTALLGRIEQAMPF